MYHLYDDDDERRSIKTMNKLIHCICETGAGSTDVIDAIHYRFEESSIPEKVQEKIYNKVIRECMSAIKMSLPNGGDY